MAYTARVERLARNHKNFRKINKLQKCCGTKFESPSQVQHLVRIVHLGGYSLEKRHKIVTLLSEHTYEELGVVPLKKLGKH